MCFQTSLEILETPGALPRPGWDHGLQTEVAAGPAGSKTRAGLGLSRRWYVAQSPSVLLSLIPCGPSIVHVDEYCNLTVDSHCSFSGESLCHSGKLEKDS